MSTPDFHALSPERILKIFARVMQGTQCDPFSVDFLCKDFAEDGTELNGQTALFRHTPPIRLIFKSLQQLNPNPLASRRILMPAASVGAEAQTAGAMAADVQLGGNAGFIIEAFDRSALFTALARVKAYPQRLVDHTRLILGDSWADLLFSKERPESGLVPVLPAIARHVHFLEPQCLEFFTPQHRYDAVIVNNLFQHVGQDQIDASLNVIKKTGAEILLFTKKGIEDLAPVAPYVDVLDHPGWHRTALGQELALLRSANVKKGLAQYVIWAHKPS